MECYQRTIANKITFSGKGLHSGRIVNVEILPAQSDTGIVFQRTDTQNSDLILANALSITSTELSTTIGRGASSISTIEHVMAAFAGLGIDNAIVRLNGPEVPILDGSAFPIARKIVDAGYRKLGACKKYLMLKEPLEIINENQFAILTPSITQNITCSIEFSSSKIIGYQNIQYSPETDSFLDISRARTFCHIKDVNNMRQQGLALGGSLQNAVVVTDTEVINKEGLRCPDEFVRHKLVDLIGDLYLLGGSLIADVKVYKPGHALHAAVTKKLLKEKDRYLAMVEIDPAYMRDEDAFTVPKNSCFPVLVYG
ncbi:MAG: UDP-3-O-[3-hydroxymyristoyl] N-acetylglucosamine deacetylase [Oligoflexales bacterium]|nr:UDP-3-O-[3-hydroxymyristoyl] N-acetylglucosamine deacetylase [Oligoflexales bacterium]